MITSMKCVTKNYVCSKKEPPWQCQASITVSTYRSGSKLTAGCSQLYITFYWYG